MNDEYERVMAEDVKLKKRHDYIKSIAPTIMAGMAGTCNAGRIAFDAQDIAKFAIKWANALALELEKFEADLKHYFEPR